MRDLYLTLALRLLALFFPLAEALVVLASAEDCNLTSLPRDNLAGSVLSCFGALLGPSPNNGGGFVTLSL